MCLTADIKRSDRLAEGWQPVDSQRSQRNPGGDANGRARPCHTKADLDENFG